MKYLKLYESFEEDKKQDLIEQIKLLISCIDFEIIDDELLTSDSRFLGKLL